MLLQMWPRYPHTKLILLFFLVIIFVIGTLPGYLTGQWSWREISSVTQLAKLQTIYQKGLVFPGWESKISLYPMGGKKWLLQQIKQTDQSKSDRTYHTKIAQILLLPQNISKDRPKSEWQEIQGTSQWQVDHKNLVKFSVAVPQPHHSQNSTIQVEANFLQGQNNYNHFAVLEWYAWSDGGSPSSHQWFWLDQVAHLFNQRVPWVACSLIIPIHSHANTDSHLTDQELYLPDLIALAQIVQSNISNILMEN